MVREGEAPLPVARHDGSAEAAQDLLRAGDRKRRNLIAQLLGLKIPDPDGKPVTAVLAD